VTLWKEKFEGKGDHMFFERLPTEQDGCFVIGLVTSWQASVRNISFFLFTQQKLILEMQLMSNPQAMVVCFDSTHNTAFGMHKEKAFLYTLVFRNPHTGKGAPIAFMLTNSEKQ
jgi:hypothetical protein